MTHAYAVHIRYSPIEDPLHPVQRTLHVLAPCAHEARDWVRGQIRRPMTIRKVSRMKALDWKAATEAKPEG